jgi:seipin
VSKPAQRAYLGTFVFAATSLIVLTLSTIAYTLFYYNYVPTIGVEKTIHLQFGYLSPLSKARTSFQLTVGINRNGHPYGAVSLSSHLVSNQPYDISLLLHLPRSPTNLQAGNFMIDLALLGPSNTTGPILALSRRPTILQYKSTLVEAAHTLTGLPWFVLGWRKESEVLKVSMFEGVVFKKGWRNIPEKVRVVLEVGSEMQFYDVGLQIVARLRGIRWFLYNHRILAYLVFTSGFFIVTMSSTLLAYFVLSIYFAPTTPGPHELKPSSIKTTSESDTEPFNPLSTSDLSDTARTFPTFGRQMPLHYTPVKKEEDVRVKSEEEQLLGVQPMIGEADDEDEEDFEETEGSRWRDSGIGTGVEDSGLKVRKRRA